MPQNLTLWAKCILLSISLLTTNCYQALPPLSKVEPSSSPSHEQVLNPSIWAEKHCLDKLKIEVLELLPAQDQVLLEAWDEILNQAGSLVSHLQNYEQVRRCLVFFQESDEEEGLGRWRIIYRFYQPQTQQIEYLDCAYALGQRPDVPPQETCFTEIFSYRLGQTWGEHLRDLLYLKANRNPVDGQFQPELWTNYLKLAQIQSDLEAGKLAQAQKNFEQLPSCIKTLGQGRALSVLLYCDYFNIDDEYAFEGRQSCWLRIQQLYLGCHRHEDLERSFEELRFYVGQDPLLWPSSEMQTQLWGRAI